jgi:hypothetical protein
MWPVRVFIAISMNDTPFADRATTLDGARAFREKGGRLVHLAFPETQAQTSATSSCCMDATKP